MDTDQHKSFKLKKCENKIQQSIAEIDKATTSIQQLLSAQTLNNKAAFNFFYTENTTHPEPERLSLPTVIDAAFSYMNTDDLAGGDTVTLIGYVFIPIDIAKNVGDLIEQINQAKYKIHQAITEVKALYNGSVHHLNTFKKARFHSRINWKMLNRMISYIDDDQITHMTFYQEQNVVSTPISQEALMKKLSALKKSDQPMTQDISVIASYPSQTIFYIRYPRKIRHAVNLYFKGQNTPQRIICSTPIFITQRSDITIRFNDQSSRKKRSDAGNYQGPIIQSLPVYHKASSN
ncbi:DNA replication terminus site-binding protein [Facilibium subflavum]|uniref:DNA replication terminus site-binding protein n=1 Tax=Facilibium subflavum TaxID=2219058 RepID=UPI000E65A1C0|nr:DNA replication terminus site-binding protein [Facilibium subflavum]